MTKTIENLFYYSALGSDLLIIFFILLFLINHKAKTSLFLIGAYCFISLLLNFLGSYVSHEFLFYAYASFTYIEYSIFSAIFLIHIQNAKFKKIILFISIIFFFFLLLYYSNQNNFLNIDSVPIGVETILILVYAFYYLYEQMNDLENSFIYNKYHFWIVIGIMLYLAGSFFIYVFANQVDNETLRNFWYLTNVFYVLKNILFGIALIILFKQSKVSSPKGHKKMYPYLN
jgi:hypothetical protein